MGSKFYSIRSFSTRQRNHWIPSRPGLPISRLWWQENTGLPSAPSRLISGALSCPLSPDSSQPPGPAQRSWSTPSPQTHADPRRPANRHHGANKGRPTLHQRRKWPSRRHTISWGAGLGEKETVATGQGAARLTIRPGWCAWPLLTLADKIQRK